MKIKIVLELFNVIPFIFASLIYPFFLLIGYLLAKYFKFFTLNISSIFCFKYFPMYFLMLAFSLCILFFMMTKYIHTHVHRYIQVLKDMAFFYLPYIKCWMVSFVYLPVQKSSCGQFQVHKKIFHLTYIIWAKTFSELSHLKSHVFVFYNFSFWTQSVLSESPMQFREHIWQIKNSN